MLTDSIQSVTESFANDLIKLFKEDIVRQVEQILNGAPAPVASGSVTPEQIRNALEQTNGNKSAAARLLGLHRATFIYHARKLAASPMVETARRFRRIDKAKRILERNSKETTDADRVLAEYKKLKNIRAVAKSLGVSRKRVSAIVRASA